MNAVARAQLTFQMLTLLKINSNARASIKKSGMGQNMSGPDNSNG